MKFSASARAGGRRFNRACGSAFRDLKNDLKNFRWLRGMCWLWAVCWFAGLFGILLLINLLLLGVARGQACLPDGSFRVTPDTYSFWSTSSFFQIAVGGGELSFTQAKAVDIIWDIGFGRGGQFALALISWRVFAQYTTVCMEVAPVNYQLYRTFFIEDSASIASTYRTIRSFLNQRGLQSRLAMIFVVFTMVFIVAFPTIASAMSGYDSNISAFVPDGDANLVPFRNFSIARFVIHDGGRLPNLSNEYIVLESFCGVGDPTIPLPTHATWSGCFAGYNSTVVDSVRSYTTQYGFGGKENKTTNYSSVWAPDSITLGPYTNRNTITLGPPALNISKYGLSSDGDDEFYFVNPSSLTWVWKNQTFDPDKLHKEGKCLTTGTYKWGFSFLQLTVCLILLLVWTSGLYIMWLKAHFTMKLRKRQHDEISGIHRGVIELSAAMQCELGMHNTDPFSLKEKELKEKVYKQLRGGGISYAYATKHSQMFSLRRGMKKWLKTDPLMIGNAVLITILSTTIWNIPSPSAIDFSFWCVGAWFGAVGALCIGNTRGSRMLFFLVWSTLFVPLPVVLHLGLVSGAGPLPDRNRAETWQW